MTNVRTLCVCVALAGVVSCSNDDSSTGPEQSVPQPATITMVTCSYQVASADTLLIDVPAVSSCDTSANTPTVSTPTQAAVSYSQRHDSLVVSLTEMMPVISVMTSAPSFSGDVEGALSQLAETEQQFGVQIQGVLLREESGSGVEGLWTFAGFAPPTINYFLTTLPDTSELGQAVQSLLADDQGRPVLLFSFESGVLTGELNRSFYGNEALHGIIDTAAYGMGISASSDSVWAVVGLTSGDTVTVTVAQSGDMLFVHDDPRSYGDHRYFLRPQACPNDLAPSWWQSWLGLNPR